MSSDSVKKSTKALKIEKKNEEKRKKEEEKRKVEAEKRRKKEEKEEEKRKKKDKGKLPENMIGKEISGPTDFKREMHIGFNKETGMFEVIFRLILSLRCLNVPLTREFHMSGR